VVEGWQSSDILGNMASEERCLEKEIIGGIWSIANEIESNQMGSTLAAGIDRECG